MSKTTGYYSIIQYCPDPSRLEAVNVGVVLFCPARNYLRARTSRSNKRIRRFFGLADIDGAQMNVILRSIQSRLEVDRDQFRDLSDLQKFAATRANAMRLTAPRPLVVEEPDEELERLFARLVAEPIHKETAQLTEALEQAFSTDDIAPLIQKQIVVTLPIFQQPIRVPYGFQNGRFNLIRPARFQDLSAKSILQRTGKYAIEGELLYRHPDERLGDLKLIVVGQFGPEQCELAQAVGEILRGNETDLFQLEEIDQLLDLIRLSARPPGALTRLP